MELHTFSSLTADFLKQYAGTMNLADEPIVYFNPHALALKKLPPLDKRQVAESFGNSNIKVFDNSKELQDYLCSKKWEGANLLLMSSGNFDGMDFAALADNIIENNQ